VAVAMGRYGATALLICFLLPFIIYLKGAMAMGRGGGSGKEVPDGKGRARCALLLRWIPKK
jgi:hypothetical protein